MNIAKEVGEALAASDHEIARRWLGRLETLVDEDRAAILPGPQLLDHVPDLVHAMANHLQRAEGSFEDRTSTLSMAAGLGELRQRQGASLHQLLREFELLGDVVHEWLAERVGRAEASDPAEWLRVMARLQTALAAWMRLSADAFARRYAESLRKERNAIEDLHRTVGHELRTPMGTIANIAALMEMEDAADEHAAVVRRSLEQMTDTLEMLRRSPPPASEGDVSVQECDLERLVRDVLVRLHDSAAARGVELAMKGEWTHVVLDVPSLDLALVNLVSNGIKYAKPADEQPWLEVHARSGEAEVVLEVRDNGIGIPPELHQRIFERGFRAHADREGGEAEGDGLGLHLVRSCAGTLGGRVEVESEPGVGSCFRLVLPRRPDTERDPGAMR